MSSPSPAHRSRKKRKDVNGSGLQAKQVVTQHGHIDRVLREPAYPLAAFLWPARAATSQWIVLPLILVLAGLYRWATGFWGYSGFQSPPMHGDFEAQRHWMEITTHLPITQWYFHDLDWWGLDYPPLTAYHSWILGQVGSLLNPHWFHLHTSRGLDDPDLKVYMRASVLVSEYLIYVPAIVLISRSLARFQRSSGWEISIALVAILMQPGAILIDHAHFQYNTVMLGFVVASTACMMSGSLLSASVFFVAALGFKQMALYYAPAVFSYLLGSCFFPKINPSRLFAIGLVTIMSFAALFSPFIVSSLYDHYRGLSDLGLQPPPLMASLALEQSSILYGPTLQLTQAIHRIFPLARGLFEDKVANFWCALHTIHKLHKYSPQTLQLLSLGMTALSILGPAVVLFVHPRRTVLLPGLAATAWGFFLFSFQVHEKSVLLPLLPMTLMLAESNGLQPSTRSWVAWANVLGSWTMFPLLKRDDLRVPYFVLTLLWAWLVGVPNMLWTDMTSTSSIGRLASLLQGLFYLAMIVWHAAEAVIATPPGKPDLWVVINVCIGAVGFGVCYLWCLWRLYGSVRGRRDQSAKGTKRN